MAPGVSCVLPPTSPNWLWLWKARRRRHACTTCSRRSMPCCVCIPRSANTTRRSDVVRCWAEARSAPHCRATDFGAPKRARRQSPRCEGARLDAWHRFGFRGTRAQSRLAGFGSLRSADGGKRRGRLRTAAEALHGGVCNLPPRARERVQVRSFGKHLDQGGNLGRDGALAPDENRRGDIEFRWQGMNTQQLQVGESLEDNAWNHRDPHACHRTAEYRVIRGGLDDAI